MDPTQPPFLCNFEGTPNLEVPKPTLQIQKVKKPAEKIPWPCK